MAVYTWWCWYIYKRDGVGVDVDQLGEETPPAATGALHRKDRVSQSASDAGHVVTVSGGREHAASVFDRTLALEVTERWQGASGQADAW